MYFNFSSGATVSENESFSLASVEDVDMPPEQAYLPPTTSLLPTSSRTTTPPSTTTTTTNNELLLLPTQPSSISTNTSEAIISEAASMLPANHVIQYSPRLASNNNSSVQWSQRPQQYDESDVVQQLPNTSDDLAANTGEPMEVDAVAMPPTNIELTGTMSCHDSNISCPLYPRETSLVTCAEVQLDHDQNLNIAEEDDLKGDINNPPIHTVASSTASMHDVVGPNATQEPVMAVAAAEDSPAPTSSTTATSCGTDVPPPTTVMTTSPEPRPRTKSFVTPNSNHLKSADMDNGPKRTPVPTPRKSVTLMEIEPPAAPASAFSNSVSGNTNPNSNFRETGSDEIIAIATVERSQSAQGGDSISATRKISFGGILNNSSSSSNNSKKLSTFSLHATSELVSEEAMVPEDVPLQRRNSIHNVPYVDVNDPNTRERMERYKEERRSLLRAKYKVEDYMTSTSEANNKYRRKSTESNSNDHESSSSTTTTTVVQLRKESPTSATINENTKNDEPPPPSTGINKNDSTSANSVSGNTNPNNPNSRETGLIDEDVNVKERAAIFGITTSKNTNNTKKNNRSKSWNMSTTTTTATNNINNKNNEINKRPISESHATNHRKLSPGSPSKIRDMAALFEQKN